MKLSAIITNYKQQRLVNKVAKEFKKDLGCSVVQKSQNKTGTVKAVLGFKEGKLTQSFAVKKDNSQVHKAFGESYIMSIIPSKAKSIRTILVDSANKVVEKTKKTLFRNNEPISIVKKTKTPSGFESSTNMHLAENSQHRLIVSPEGKVLVNELTPIK